MRDIRGSGIFRGMNRTRTILVLCTCPDRATAEKIADSLIADKVAACVNLTPPVTSFFEWEGRRETEEEVLLLIKSTSSSYARLERSILELHPYDVPEIIAVPVEQGLAGYLEWVDQCTQGS